MRRRLKVLVCRGPECGEKRHSADVHAALVRRLREAPLQGAEVEIGWQSCFGQCAHGPNMLVREVRPGENSRLIDLMPTMAPGAVLYHGVRPTDVEVIVRDHLQSGRPVAELTRKTDRTR